MSKSKITSIGITYTLEYKSIRYSVVFEELEDCSWQVFIFDSDQKIITGYVIERLPYCADPTRATAVNEFRMVIDNLIDRRVFKCKL